MRQRLSICAVMFFLIISLSAQNQRVDNPVFQEKLEEYLDEDLPVISVQLLKSEIDQYVLLDAREKTEYDISHIPNAIHLGYPSIRTENIEGIQKDQKIVVYCSIGYRSEKMTTSLREMGYENVYNLYGSILEWVNQGYELEDNTGKGTQNVHTYNRKWSEYMINPDYKKFW